MKTTTRARWVTALAATGIVGGVGLSACSSQVEQVQSKLSFAQAYARTAEAQDMSMTMSLRTTKADVQKLFDAAEKTSSTPADPQTKQVMGIVADLLPKLTITSKAHSNGKPLSQETDPAKLDQSATIALDGAGLDVLTLGKDTFVKVDVAGIGQKTGLFTLNQAKLMLASVPAELSWVSDVVDGKWIGLPASAMDSLTAKQGASGITDPVQQKKLRDAVQRSLERNSSLEKTGSKDGADQMTVKVKVKPFAQDLQAAMKDAGATSTASTTDLKGLKADAVMQMQALVKDDRITHAEVDLPQVFSWFDESTMSADDKKTFEAMKTSGFTGALVADYDTAAVSITKPAGARVLTPEEIDTMTRNLGSAADATAPGA